MLRKHSILLGMVISLLLLLVATLNYRGGSLFDEDTNGFHWTKNFLCNLFGATAVNGMENNSRIWAIIGTIFYSGSFALFFVEFSKKIPDKGAANIIKYAGVGAMAATLLVVKPYHETMVVISSTLALLSMFYITVYIFRSKLYWLKLLSVVCMLMLYACIYVYYTQHNLRLLHIMQKMALFMTIGWVLCLHYFTGVGDFQAGGVAGGKENDRSNY